MKRKIIEIDEVKCNGCGQCIPNCPEGAIQIIDGKARLISDLFCDGLGACLGHCPEGAITVIEREAGSYDERRVMENIVKQGKNVIKAHLDHLRDHKQDQYLKEAQMFLKEKKIEVPKEEAAHQHHSGCPGMKVIDLRKPAAAGAKGDDNVNLSSELGQWPVQLKLLNPSAPYFNDADLLIAADCVPFAFPNFHKRFLKGKTLVIFCPKLDEGLDEYVEKLSQIFSGNNIKSITIAHMEVPCCFGTTQIVEEALKKSGKNITIKDYTISLQGEIA